MTMRAATLAGLLTLLVVAPGAARAQPAPSPPDESRARELHQQGSRHYDIGEYDAAIDDFKAAYALSPAAGLLFNIAQAYRMKGTDSCAEALRYYRSYLRAAPNAENRESVEK